MRQAWAVMYLIYGTPLSLAYCDLSLYLHNAGAVQRASVHSQEYACYLCRAGYTDPPLCRPSIQLLAECVVDLEESKRSANQRANLDPWIESFINSVQDNSEFEASIHVAISDHNLVACLHNLLATTFRPNTNITTYNSLTDRDIRSRGLRSKNSAHELSWTVLNLNRHAAPPTCCNNCNPSLAQPYLPSAPDDPWFFAQANDFIHPIAYPPLPPSSTSSVFSSLSIDSTASTPFEPLKRGARARHISKEEKVELHVLHEAWLDKQHERFGSSVFLSRDLGLPPRQMNKLLTHCGKFLLLKIITKKDIQRVVKLDMNTDTKIAEIRSVIDEWRIGLKIHCSPQSQQRPAKKRNAGENDMPTPLPQPIFCPSSSSWPSLNILRRWQAPPLPTPPPSYHNTSNHYSSHAQYTPQSIYNTPQNYSYYTPQTPYQIPSRPLSSFPSNYFSPIPAPHFLLLTHCNTHLAF